jgi:hypothetical protein
MSRLTYDDFYRTGIQDCGNTFDVSDHRDAWRRIGKPHGASAAIDTVKAAWGDDGDAYEAWLEQADVVELSEHKLDPRATYKVWRDAWQSCAASRVKAKLPEWIRRDDE